MDPRRALAGLALAIDEDALRRALSLVDAPQAATGGRSRGALPGGTKGVAVIPIVGMMEYHATWLGQLFGSTSTKTARMQVIDAANDPDVHAIALMIDSPGGSVTGTPELAAAVRAARAQKPVTALVDGMAASAAYWVAAQADEVVVTPSGEVGSIGVFAIHIDESKALDREGLAVDVIKSSLSPFKAEGLAGPLPTDARAYVLAQIDDAAREFIRDVATGRKRSVTQVAETFGKGRMLAARPALAAGMIDRIEVVETALARLQQDAPARAAQRRQATAQAESDIRRVRAIMAKHRAV